LIRVFFSSFFLSSKKKYRSQKRRYFEFFMKISTLITASENSFANSDPLSVRTNAMEREKHLKTELKEFLVACEA